jgi:hypothetical protein
VSARRLGLLALGATALVARPAVAAVDGNVGLTLRDCAAVDGLDEQALREHLQLELVTLKLEHSRATLSVRCEQGAARIELERSPGDRYPIQVRVELRDTAKAARERLVALAATELLSQAERARTNQAAVEARSRPAPSMPAPLGHRLGDMRREETSRRRRPVELFVAGSVALHGAPKTTLWGGSLGTLLRFGRRWSLLFDTRFERGIARQSLLDVRWSALSGFAGAVARIELGSLDVALGGGARAGWLALDATAREPYEGKSFTAPWAGVALPLRLSTELPGWVVPFAGLEAGYVLLPVHGSSTAGERLVEQKGPWLSCSAGLGVAL